MAHALQVSCCVGGPRGLGVFYGYGLAFAVAFLTGGWGGLSALAVMQGVPFPR